MYQVLFLLLWRTILISIRNSKVSGMKQNFAVNKLDFFIRCKMSKFRLTVWQRKMDLRKKKVAKKLRVNCLSFFIIFISFLFLLHFTASRVRWIKIINYVLLLINGLINMNVFVLTAWGCFFIQSQYKEN